MIFAYLTHKAFYNVLSSGQGRVRIGPAFPMKMPIDCQGAV
jgi:hypothetical protein